MSELITIDFETFYSKTFSLSKMTTEEYIRSPEFEVIGVAVKREQDNKPTWFSGTLAQTKEFLDTYEFEAAKVVSHNMAFDGAILGWIFDIHPKMLIDTLGMAKPKFGTNVGGSLAKLSTHFKLGEKGTEVINALGKQRADFTPEELSKYGEYCRNDVVLTEALFHALKEYTTPQELYVIDLLLRMYTDPVFELDVPLLEKHLVNVKDKKAELMAKLDASIGKDELMSNPKFALVLEKLGVEVPMKLNPKGEPAYAFAKTDTAFKALLEHEDIKVQTVVAARFGNKSTLEETRTESFISIAGRGKLPVPLGYYNAHTGRAGGWDKINLQNMPRGGNLRRSIKTPEGHSIVAGDSAQIEARILAWFAGQNNLVEAFARGEDIYSMFASKIYGREVKRKWEVIVDGVKTYPDAEAGFVGKVCILSLGFGVGHAKLRSSLKTGGNIDISEAESERIVKLYRTEMDAINRLWKSADRALEAMAAGREFYLGLPIKLHCTPEGIKLPNGMMLYYPNIRKEADERGRESFVYDGRYTKQYVYGAKLIENCIQALARIVVFNQMCKIDQKLRKHDNKVAGRRFKVAGTVHDENITVVPTPAIAKVKVMMEKIMTEVPKWATGLPIACEVKAGSNYAECK